MRGRTPEKSVSRGGTEGMGLGGRAGRLQVGGERGSDGVRGDTFRGHLVPCQQRHMLLCK